MFWYAMPLMAVLDGGVKGGKGSCGTSATAKKNGELRFPPYFGELRGRGAFKLGWRRRALLPALRCALGNKWGARNLRVAPQGCIVQF